MNSLVESYGHKLTPMYPGTYLGYARVSTDDQADHGVSLEAQEQRIRSYAGANGIELSGVFVDAGKSAKDLGRPALAYVLGRIGRGEARGLIVAKLDRLTRSVRDWSRLVEDFFSTPDGPRILSASETIDTRSASGRMIANIMVSVSQCERETGIERTSAAVEHKRSKGERIGTIPYGSRLDADGKTLVPDADEQGAIGVMRRFRASGSTLAQIAALLDQLGIATRSGGKWAVSSVAKILGRAEVLDQAEGEGRPDE